MFERRASSSIWTILAAPPRVRKPKKRNLRHRNRRRLWLTIALAIFFVILNIPIKAAPPCKYNALSLGADDESMSLANDLDILHSRGICIPDESPIRTPSMLRHIAVSQHASSVASLNSVVSSIDTIKALVILVDFADNPHDRALAPYFSRVDATPGMFDSLLFSTGRRNLSGSMTEYYLENSYGSFLIQGDVTRWYRMPKSYASYVDAPYHGQGYGTNAQDLAWDAIIAADPDINFTDYDRYGPNGVPDGRIDALIVVHAGTGHEETAGFTFDDIHSHKWNLRYPLTRDSILLNAYIMLPEESYRNQEISSIGVFCHEFGHLLGLPDLYDIDERGATSAGLGEWSLMATGCYLGRSRYPAHLDAWSKSLVGFIQPQLILSNRIAEEIPQVESVGVVYRLWTAGAQGREYFLVENREKIGFDQALPGAGLLIYHVDLNANQLVYGNINAARYLVALEQADGNNDLEYTPYNRGDEGDPFDGLHGAREFTDNSVPSSRSNDSATTEVAVWQISPPGAVMWANFDVFFSRPHFSLVEIHVSDNGNVNDTIDPGESATIHAVIRNDGADADSVSIQFESTNDELLAIIDHAQISALNGRGGSVEVRFEVLAPDTLHARIDSFFFDVKVHDSVFARLGAEVTIGSPQIFVVNADANGDYLDQYVKNLRALRQPFATRTITTEGSPNEVTISRYPTVIWFYGSSESPPPSTDLSLFRRILDNGGNLLLSGQRFAEFISESDPTFLSDYLRTSSDTSYYSAIQYISADASIGRSLPQVRFFGNGGAANWNSSTSRSISPIGGARPLTISGSGATHCFSQSYAGECKVVFFSAPFEAIQNDNATYARREDLLGEILTFFDAGRIVVAPNISTNASALPATFELEQNFPNPFNPTTHIRYNVYTDHRVRATLRIYNVIGQCVRTQVSEPEGRGPHELVWNGVDDQGREVASGVYFYSLERDMTSRTRKMVLLR